MVVVVTVAIVATVLYGSSSINTSRNIVLIIMKIRTHTRMKHTVKINNLIMIRMGSLGSWTEHYTRDLIRECRWFLCNGGVTLQEIIAFDNTANPVFLCLSSDKELLSLSSLLLLLLVLLLLSPLLIIIIDIHMFIIVIFISLFLLSLFLPLFSTVIVVTITIGTVILIIAGLAVFIIIIITVTTINIILIIIIIIHYRRYYEWI